MSVTDNSYERATEEESHCDKRGLTPKRKKHAADSLDVLWKATRGGDTAFWPNVPARSKTATTPTQTRADTDAHTPDTRTHCGSIVRNTR